MNPISEELEKIAYEKAHDWIQHYSGIIYRLRISLFTFSVILIAFLLGVKITAPETILNFDQSLIKAISSYIYSIMICLIFNLETGYFRRLAKIVESARLIEEKHHVTGNFNNYNTGWRWPLHLLYISLIFVFLGIFITICIDFQTHILYFVLLASIPLLFFFVLVSQSPRRKADNNPNQFVVPE